MTANEPLNTGHRMYLEVQIENLERELVQLEIDFAKGLVNGEDADRIAKDKYRQITEIETELRN